MHFKISNAVFDRHKTAMLMFLKNLLIELNLRKNLSTKGIEIEVFIFIFFLLRKFDEHTEILQILETFRPQISKPRP